MNVDTKLSVPVRTKHYVLVVPGSATDIATGAGQRSAIFASALARCGRVSVLVLGEADFDRARATFADCAEIRFVCLGLPSEKREIDFVGHWVTRMLFQIMPRYRIDAQVAAELDDLVTSNPAIVVFRYFWPLCKTGLFWSKKKHVRWMIDVDDRDDRSPLALGRTWYRRLQAVPILDHAVRVYMRLMLNTMLRGAAHVWFVRADDSSGLVPTRISVAPNVSFCSVAGCPVPSKADEVVLFVGSSAHAGNVEGVRWFLTNCWPDIQRLRPAARFRVVGSGNWKALLGGWNTAASVEIIGFVDDLVPEYAAARVVISPVFNGGGTKIKVVEACAFGRPVVATSLSASGFGVEIETAIRTADDASNFGKETVKLLTNGERADQLGGELRVLQQKLLSRDTLEKLIETDALWVASKRGISID